MKKLLLITACCLMFFSLYANPWSTATISEVWFGENGHFYMEICPTFPDIQNYNQYEIMHGDTLVHITDDLPITQMLVVDVDTLSPHLTFNQENDAVGIRFSYFDFTYYDGVNWGYGEYNAHPPLPGQSLVKSHSDDLWDTGAYLFIDEPPTPGISPFEPVARDTLFILVTNAEGIPQPNIPICVGEYSSFNPPWEDGYTNFYGIYYDIFKAGHKKIKVLHPYTEEVLFTGDIWLEPNDTSFLAAEINYTPNLDYTTPPVRQEHLSAYPVPFNQGKADYLTFRYTDRAKLNKDSFIRIYDSKGRFITQVTMSAKGETSWKPSGEIAAGYYLARLVSGNRILDTTALTIIK